MRISFVLLSSLFVAVCVIGFTACGKNHTDASADGEDHAAHGHDEHDHGHEGPHGGHIIELGTEEYHAELVHDKAPIVGIYFLGSDAKMAKPIEAESVIINTSVDGESSQYTLTAAPQEGESGGSASYFELESEPLHSVVSGESEAAKTHARLNVKINDKPYVGLIETDPHDHDHAHDHAH